MRKLIVSMLTVLLTATTFAQEDPVIMTINDKKITKSEFLQIYLKNNNDPKYDKVSLDEYMELFKKFKLKVAEAEALGYDTIPRLVKELNGYRKQLALPYLIDSTKNEDLIKEAYERTNTELRASHILIRVDPKASPEDTLKAYNKLIELKKRIESGEDFAKIAKSKEGSEDPSVQTNGGDLGYFTAFQMVYPFEDVAYKTPVGKVSDPFRTRFGYHIVKVTDSRPARGTIEAAHIMIATNRNASPEELESANNKITEIYELLQNGSEWDDMVAKYSDDPSSNTKGGKLPIFGTGSKTRMVPEFEDAAFALDTDGEISKPVRTDYGFHIVKRISHMPIPSFEEMRKELENKVAKDQRSKQTQSSFVEKKKKEYNFNKKNNKPILWFTNVIDTSYYKGKFEAKVVTKNKPIFTLDGNTYGQKDFAKYLERNWRSVRRGMDIEEMLMVQYNKWEKQTILNHEESKLPSKYPAYKALITEYHDGILLYEIMSDMVWNKAMRDTTGLKAFFEENKSNYMWGKRLDAEIFECYSKEAAEKAHKMLQNDTISATTVINSVNDESELNIRHRNGKFDVTKTRFFKGVDLKEGLNDIYESDGKYLVVKVNKILEPSQKEFSEAKGAVTSDYQTHLEEEWLKELAAKHKITVNQEALYSIGQ